MAEWCTSPTSEQWKTKTLARPVLFLKFAFENVPDDLGSFSFMRLSEQFVHSTSFMRVTVQQSGLAVEKRNKMKRQLCLTLRRRFLREGWTHRQAAMWLGASPRSISYFVRGYVERVTFNQIFEYLVALDPTVEIMVSFD